jgi:subtilase family serine protease
MRTQRRIFRPRLDQLDDRCLLSGYNVAQVTNAYGLNAIAFQSASGAIVPGNGAGETIALIEAYHDPSLAADLHVFDQANNLPDPTLTVDNLAGAKTNSTWASEESLDVEWAHAIAPGADILVVEAQSQTLTDLLSAVDTARSTPGVVAISMSWGFSEMADETSYDTHFTTPAGHAGITFVAASGDNGLRAGAEYPAASPDVLAVGGTTLNLGDAGNYLSETAWQDSGGGYSLYEPEPSYQDSIQSTGYRSTSDVAFDGNPNTGVTVYETPLHGGPGAWQTVGGTSLGTPAWAAIIAIVDQGRALAGKGSLDGPTQTLPALYSLPSTDFHVVGTPPPQSAWGGGVNPFGFLSLGWPFLRRHSRKTTGPAAGSTSESETKLATGLGSPNDPALVADLVAGNITIPLTTASNGGASISPTEPMGKGSKRHRSVRLQVAARPTADDIRSRGMHAFTEIYRVGWTHPFSIERGGRSS